MIPDAVRRQAQAALGAIHDAHPVGGGSINQAFRLTTDGGPAFLKLNAHAPRAMFDAEADGLRALSAAAGEVRVPRVLALGGAGTAAEPGWLALEWLEPAPRAPGFWERLGRGLAALHRAAGGGWGWERPNFIGSLPQANESAETWAGFWRARRLEPQLRLAADSGRLPGSRAEWERLFARLDDLVGVGDEEGPSLLHGDLWSGNVVSASGEPAIVDPAVYRGHREVDLAMAELFGGFDARFHAAYREAWPLAPGYERERRSVYQLYYLLVHVNLFGGAYVGQTAEVLRRVA